MTTLTKAALAERLKCPVSDLLTRKQVAAITGLGADTLRTKSQYHVGFFKISDKQTDHPLYPKAWVLEYKKWREGGKKGSFRGKTGLQNIDDFVEKSQINGKTIMLLMERWKYREIANFCDAIFDSQNSYKELMAKHRSNIFYAPDGTKRHDTDPVLAPVLNEKFKEIVAPVFVLDNPDVAIAAMYVTWEGLLDIEEELLGFMKG